MTPEQRSLRARMAANARWSKTTDRSQSTTAARAAFFAKFEKQVDPQGELSTTERSLRAEYAMRAHMQRLAFLRSTKSAAS